MRRHVLTYIFNFLAGPFGRLVGRRRLVRFGEFIVRAGRLDYPNSLDTNGEYTLQKIFLENVQCKKIIVFDCGANYGKWTESFVKKASNYGYIDFDFFCFEPASWTFDKLQLNLKDKDSRSRRIHLVNMGLSSETGVRKLGIVHDGAGSNSIDGLFRIEDEMRFEEIEVVTLDGFSKSKDLTHIHFMKIDAEGHDSEVIKGAFGLMSSKSIDLIQFEYNWLWKRSSCFLRQIFELTAPTDYSIAKLTPVGLMFMDEYSDDLDTFVEGNYVICNQHWRNVFSRHFSVD